MRRADQGGARLAPTGPRPCGPTTHEAQGRPSPPCSPNGRTGPASASASRRSRCRTGRAGAGAGYEQRIRAGGLPEGGSVRPVEGWDLGRASQTARWGLGTRYGTPEEAERAVLRAGGTVCET
ncbi:DUF1266 domain-containing protein [Streptomyces sp. NPDC060048]|uniref:DUF1266 domain-containing protein n=1 Tax=unclassified Streptomyces TaxID=2593676 RepID=UPI00368724F2